jgi:two-component system chemotaxis response regulator CheB
VAADSDRIPPDLATAGREAATEYGERVADAALPGAHYDGSAGRRAIKRRGGLAIVQDPADAIVESMPRSALRLVQADHVLPVAEIGPLLAELGTRGFACGDGTTVDDRRGYE